MEGQAVPAPEERPEDGPRPVPLRPPLDDCGPGRPRQEHPPRQPPAVEPSGVGRLNRHAPFGPGPRDGPEPPPQRPPLVPEPNRLPRVPARGPHPVVALAMAAEASPPTAGGWAGGLGLCRTEAGGAAANGPGVPAPPEKRPCEAGRVGVVEEGLEADPEETRRRLKHGPSFHERRRPRQARRRPPAPDDRQAGRGTINPLSDMERTGRDTIKGRYSRHEFFARGVRL